MTHIDDDELVLHYYRESADAPAVEAHIAGCAPCRARFESLSADLAVMDGVDAPERGEWYGAMVWARLSPQIEAIPPRPWWARLLPVRPVWRGLAVAGTAAAVVLAAFLVGRHSQPEPPTTPDIVAADTAPTSARDSEQILLAAVGDHLSRSRVVLAEIANRGANIPSDISIERAAAEDLVAASRLYRQTAVSRGDTAIALVLEQLERTLLEIANAPSDASPADLQRLRDRIESQSLLFTITVLNSQVQQRQRDAAADRAARTGAST